MATNVRIVTDSGLYLDRNLIDHYNVVVVPLQVQLGGKIYQEGINITNSTFLKLQTKSQDMPVVSPPPVQAWTQLYQSLARESAYVIVLTQSSRLSNTFQRAREATGYVIGRVRIWVVDTQTVGLGQGILVREAAKMAAEGMPAPEIVRHMRAMIPHIYAQFLIDRLDYLEKYGRVGPAQALLGTMLGVKPIVAIEDGELIPMEKVQNWEKGIEKLHDFVVEFLHIEEMAVVQHGMEEQTALFLERLEMTFEGRSFPVISYGPSLSAHLGPTALGVIVYEGLT